MEEMIKKFNDLFESNSFTDGERVYVELVQKGKAILVVACDEIELIKDLDRFTDYGIMMEIMRVVDKLYCSGCVPFFEQERK